MAIPAVYRDDQYIKDEPWYSRKEIMYYEGNVEDSYYNERSKQHSYKIKLSLTGKLVWLSEDELKEYNFSAKPSNAEWVAEQKEDNIETSEDDDVLSISKKPKQSKRRKIVRAISSWYKYIIIALFHYKSIL